MNKSPITSPQPFWPGVAAWPWGPYRADARVAAECMEPTAAFASPMISIFDQTHGPRRGRTTMDLLNVALESDNLRGWSRRLGLSEQALRTARSRGRLSPAIAGSLAEELSEDPSIWIV